jgi:hypothetical protein
LTKSLEVAKWVYVDFSNGDLIPRDWIMSSNDEELELLILHLICVKLLSPISHFKETYENLEKLSKKELIQKIHDHWKTPPLKIIQLHVDEYQYMLNDKDMNILAKASPPKLQHENKPIVPKEKEKDGVPFRKFARSLMKLAMKLAQSEILIFPFFTGTVDVYYLNVFPATEYTLVPHYLQPGNILFLSAAMLF